MLKARYTSYTLKFKVPSGTSRGVLREKESYFVAIHDMEDPEAIGLGECGVLEGLSADDRPDYEEKLDWACHNISLPKEELDEALMEYPSIRFGLEMALADLNSDGEMMFFDTPFVNENAPIPINGLVWMGSAADMSRRIEQKIKAGFKCIKLKIGAIDFEEELKLLKGIRQDFSAKDLEIRVDANGAFAPEGALKKLESLSKFDLHSIEQPIAPGQTDIMATLCRNTPVPIALDEELIGVFDPLEQLYLIKKIRPQFVIIKPSLLGGWKASEEWISHAESSDAGWWVTSALESNVGLNAIAQWTAKLNPTIPQGLGTGQLYDNNFTSPLRISQGQLYHSGYNWELDELWEQPWEVCN